MQKALNVLNVLAVLTVLPKRKIDLTSASSDVNLIGADVPSARQQAD